MPLHLNKGKTRSKRDSMGENNAVMFSYFVM